MITRRGGNIRTSMGVDLLIPRNRNDDAGACLFPFLAGSSLFLLLGQPNQKKLTTNSVISPAGFLDKSISREITSVEFANSIENYLLT